MAMQTEAATVQGGRRSIACEKANRHGCGSNTVKAEPVEAIVVAHVSKP